MANHPIVIDIKAPSFGWTTLTIQAGEQQYHIRCSEVYDPFGELHALMERLEEGGCGNVLIDQEGRHAMFWVDREPGNPNARLRVFVPGIDGQIEELQFDAQITIDSLLNAWADAALKFMAEMDSNHWESLGIERLDTAAIEQMARRQRTRDQATRRKAKAELAFEPSL